MSGCATNPHLVNLSLRSHILPQNYYSSAMDETRSNEQFVVDNNNLSTHSFQGGIASSNLSASLLSSGSGVMTQTAVNYPARSAHQSESIVQSITPCVSHTVTSPQAQDQSLPCSLPSTGVSNVPCCYALTQSKLRTKVSGSKGCPVPSVKLPEYPWVDTAQPVAHGAEKVQDTGKGGEVFIQKLPLCGVLWRVYVVCVIFLSVNMHAICQPH